MAVYRVEKTHDYTVMANHHLRDERLSLKAKGLLSMLLSLPDDWEISIRGLASIVTDGVVAVQTGINELIEAGYIVRRRQHADTGAFAGFEYIIHEVPPCTENPYTANPYTGKPYTENPALRNTDRLSTILPPIVPQSDADGGNPSVSLAADTSPVRGGKEGETGDAVGGNPSVSLAADTSPVRGGTEGEKGKAAEDDPLRQPAAATSPGGRGKRRGTAKKAPDYRPDTFARFWAAYPRGEDKQGAIAAWDELKPDDATLQAMSRALVRQRASEEWQRGIGIPYAVRWLRRRRWEDEIKAPAPPPESAGGDLPVWN